MTTPRALLDDAGGALARAEALLERAAAELGPPFSEPLRLMAADAERLRRRIRTATIAATGP